MNTYTLAGGSSTRTSTSTSTRTSTGTNKKQSPTCFVGEFTVTYLPRVTTTPHSERRNTDQSNGMNITNEGNIKEAITLHSGTWRNTDQLNATNITNITNEGNIKGSSQPSVIAYSSHIMDTSSQSLRIVSSSQPHIMDSSPRPHIMDCSPQSPGNVGSFQPHIMEGSSQSPRNVGSSQSHIMHSSSPRIDGSSQSPTIVSSSQSMRFEGSSGPTRIVDSSVRNAGPLHSLTLLNFDSFEILLSSRDARAPVGCGKAEISLCHKFVYNGSKKLHFARVLFPHSGHKLAAQILPHCRRKVGIKMARMGGVAFVCHP